jgi:hypothetical protein
MSLSVLAPESYEEAHQVAAHWAENTIFVGLFHTDREVATTAILNSNLMAVPHFDPGD